MNETFVNINEERAATAFTKQSVVFDELYSANEIIQYKRERVRKHVQKLLTRNSNILELNCGTGEDATWFAKNGYTAHATDISSGMLNVLQQKIKTSNIESKVSFELCSFTELNKLHDKGPYDLIFSNFAGLNCTDELAKVLLSYSPLLKRNGIVTLVLLSKFCLWEFLLLFKGKFKTAFRRFFSSNGRKAHIEGEYFKCWYYNPSFVIRHLKKDFELLSIEGLCTLVPPSYVENFATKYPRAFQFLKSKEDKWKHRWPWRSIGDYYIISLRKSG